MEATVKEAAKVLATMQGHSNTFNTYAGNRLSLRMVEYNASRTLSYMSRPQKDQKIVTIEIPL